MADETPADETPVGHKPFAAFVQETRGGALHGELSDALAELVAACREHEKAGALQLTIKVEPNKDGITVQVSDEVKVKAPEADRGAALFFADSRGNLSRRNPHQPELPLREVGGKKNDNDDEKREAAEA